ncbi:hypothetical protein Tco_0964132 [Tanacetum coccineum]
MKSTKPKKKGVVLQELSTESTTTISSQLSSHQLQDKGKGLLIEPVKPIKKKDQIRLDEEISLNLQARFDEEERLAREKDKKEKEANIALIETWDDIHAKIDLKDLKLKEFDSIQEMFNRAFKRQKVEDEKEIAELKQCLEIIPAKEEVTIDAIPLAVKIFSQMFKSFDSQDLEDLYKLVKAEYESTRPVEDLDLLLWGDLKTMFEPHVEDKVWRNQQDHKVLDWKLYDSFSTASTKLLLLVKVKTAFEVNVVEKLQLLRIRIRSIEVGPIAKVGEDQLIGPELVQETTKKISQIKDRLKVARDHEKSVVRFRKKRKLAARFVRPFEIIKKVGPMAYRLDFHEELNDVHDTFHVSNLKKCLADPTLQVPLDEI